MAPKMEAVMIIKMVSFTLESFNKIHFSVAKLELLLFFGTV